MWQNLRFSWKFPNSGNCCLFPVPSTFQRLMTAIFQEKIGRFAHVYLDGIFIYSHTIWEHEHHLEVVFSKLREAHMFLSKEKINLYSKSMDCLGHLIDDQGVHADADEMQHIHEWRRPWLYHKVQWFLGLVQYLAHYMPDVTAYTTPLSGCARNNCLFLWTPLVKYRDTGVWRWSTECTRCVTSL
jgi:Reverse transcriptase (RNA-dependent DNA polymerase)